MHYHVKNALLSISRTVNVPFGLRNGIAVENPDGVEFRLELICSIRAYSSPGKLYGPPENCYPSEKDIEIEALSAKIYANDVPIPWAFVNFPPDIYKDLSAEEILELEEKAWEAVDTQCEINDAKRDDAEYERLQELYAYQDSIE